MEKMNGYVRFSNEEILEMRKNPKNVEVIVENSEGFVKSCLKGIYLSSDYSYDDKLQVAYGGLLIAIEKFDEKQSNFYGFAKRCIQTELFNVHRGYTRNKRGYDKETNTQQITVCSLDIQNNDGDSIVENVEDETVNTFKQAFGINSDLEKIYKILSPAQQYAFTEYFLEEKTLKEIAEAHGVTTTRAGNLTKQVIKKIKENFTEAEFAEIIGLR
jgi:RNA polymerase sigma factor (sigma-70 family)